MGIYEFIALDENAKANTVWEGRYLADRTEDYYGIQLYSIEDFFVEVFYNKPINKIEKFRPFKNKTLLEPYLDKIDISSI